MITLKPRASIAAGRSPSRHTLRSLDWPNFFLADVQTGVGPFLAIFLAAYGWNEQRVGIILTAGGIAGILTQTPAGALAYINPNEIDYEIARGADDGEKILKAEKLRALLTDRPLVSFLVAAVMFHFANAAMLPLLGERLVKGHGRSSMMFMSACVVTTQRVVTFMAAWTGRKAGLWGS